MPLRNFQQTTNAFRMFTRPLMAATNRPGVHDVAIENQLGAAGVLEKMRDLFDLAVGGAEVDIGQDDRSVTQDRFFHVCVVWGVTTPRYGDVMFFAANIKIELVFGAEFTRS